MRTKKEFSFDEEKDAEEIITNGFKTAGIDYGKMYTIAKYFRHFFGYGQVRLERELIKFCKEQDKNFNPVIEADSIKKWIKSAMTYELRKISQIPVSQKEITFLKSIETEKDRKLLFATLILSKALKSVGKKINETKKQNDKFYVRYSSFKNIVQLAGMPTMPETALADVFYKYIKEGHITPYNPEKELIRIDYADSNPEKEIYITNLDDVMGEYRKLFGENTCEVCGKEFIKNSNRQKVCSDCSKILNQKRVAKFRERERQNEKNRDI